MSTTTTAPESIAAENVACAPQPATKATTFVVFSGELDRQLLAFTLANAAAASGARTTMFFAFWGVAALRRRRVSRGKRLVERMFGWMIPCGAGRLPMSRMNFLGLGRALMGWRMRKVGMASLDQLVEAAEALGVELIACEATLGMMGFRPDELRASVTVGGAAGCLESAMQADASMVI